MASDFLSLAGILSVSDSTVTSCKVGAGRPGTKSPPTAFPWPVGEGPVVQVDRMPAEGPEAVGESVRRFAAAALPTAFHQVTR